MLAAVLHTVSEPRAFLPLLWGGVGGWRVMIEEVQSGRPLGFGAATRLVRVPCDTCPGSTVQTKQSGPTVCTRCKAAKARAWKQIGRRRRDAARVSNLPKRAIEGEQPGRGGSVAESTSVIHVDDTLRDHGQELGARSGIKPGQAVAVRRDGEQERKGSDVGGGGRAD